MKGIIIFLLIVIAVNCEASSLPDFPFLLSTGEARLEVQPDRVEITLTIEEFNKEPNVALKIVNERALELIGISKKYGVQHDDITSYQIDKRIRRNRGKSYEDLEIIGYEFSQPFKLILNSIDRYPEYLEELLKLKNVDGINASYDVSNRNEFETKLVILASEDARKNATQLSEAMDVRLGSIYALTQDSHFGSFFANFGLKKEDFDNAQPPPDNPGHRLGLFAPKSISLYQTIYVVYKIKP